MSQKNIKSYPLEVLRHSAAHLLAHAINQLYPGTLFTLGPATETGFFYDIINPNHRFKQEDLAVITVRMKELVAQDISISHSPIPKDDAKKMFADNKYKLDIIEKQIKEDVAGIARQGDFIDLCKGGHVDSTGSLGNFLLTGISGSYWRGDREGDALQRISGIIFPTKEELEAHLKLQAELAEYDHRRLGVDMDLFSFQPEGPGFPFFHPKGMQIIGMLTTYMRMLCHKKYQEVKTPTLLSSDLWKQSGHYKHYKDNMYFVNVDEKEFVIKPMNCPGMFLIFNSRPRSYRELPLRMSEFGHVHRHELSGALSGLTRVRAFTQDDAHIFCTLEQVEDEIVLIMQMIEKMLKLTGFNDYTIAVSTRPTNYAGELEKWDIATKALEDALKKCNKEYTIKEGEGAFYGPKIEITLKDSFSREWQCGTIQVDFVQPENFDLCYITPEGKRERVVVIHQAMYGSLERFFALLLEHHRGSLPYWLTPVQVKVLSLTDACSEYAKEIYDLIALHGIRSECDFSPDPINAKIQRAQKEKVACMFIIGKKEVAEKTVSIRWRDGKQEQGISKDIIMHKINDTIWNTCCNDGECTIKK